MNPITEITAWFRIDKVLECLIFFEELLLKVQCWNHDLISKPTIFMSQFNAKLNVNESFIQLFDGFVVQKMSVGDLLVVKNQWPNFLMKSPNFILIQR